MAWSKNTMFPKEFTEDWRQYCIPHYVTYIRWFYILCRPIIKRSLHFDLSHTAGELWLMVLMTSQSQNLSTDGQTIICTHGKVLRSLWWPVKMVFDVVSIVYHIIVYICNWHQYNICICAICSPSRSDCSALGANDSYKCYQSISAQAGVIIGCYTHRHDK